MKFLGFICIFLKLNQNIIVMHKLDVACANVNKSVCLRLMCPSIVSYPHWVPHFLIFTPGIGTVQSLFSGENSAFAHFAAVIGNHYNLAVLIVPPGTHHCWVGRGSVIWEACPTPLHMARGHVLPYVWELWSDQLASSRQYFTCFLWLANWEHHFSSGDCSATFHPSVESNAGLLLDRQEF